MRVDRWRDGRDAGDSMRAGEYDLAGFISWGVVDRDRHHHRRKSPGFGDVLLGPAIEMACHTNGYSLARKFAIRDREVYGQTNM